MRVCLLLLLAYSAAALYTKDGKIYNEQGEIVTMHGALCIAAPRA